MGVYVHIKKMCGIHELPKSLIDTQGSCRQVCIIYPKEKWKTKTKEKKLLFQGTFVTGDGIAPHVTSYDLHIRKNLVALPALKLPLNTQDHFPAQSSSGRCMPTIAEVAFVEALRKGLNCDVMLVDKHAFGKGSGVELGRFVLKWRFGAKSGDPICHFPPLVLLACKLEENEKDLQSLGFSDNICKPIKPSALATILSKVSPDENCRIKIRATQLLMKKEWREKRKLEYFT